MLSLRELRLSLRLPAGFKEKKGTVSTNSEEHRKQLTFVRREFTELKKRTALYSRLLEESRSRLDPNIWDQFQKDKVSISSYKETELLAYF